MGFRSGLNTTIGSQNTFIGADSGGSNTTGTLNTFVGADAGYYVTTGSKNTILGKFNGNQGGLDIRTSSNNIVLSDGDGNPRVIVNSSGNMQVGHTNGDNSRLAVEAVSAGVAMQFRRNTATYTTSAIVGSITCDGSSTAFNTSSDHRLKENVVYDWDATTRLKQLKPARFNFIADADTTVDGFLAHEAQAVVPEAVTGTHNEVDDDGVAVMQGIDQSKLVPLLVKAIQEQQALIESLTARIETLEG